MSKTMTPRLRFIASFARDPIVAGCPNSDPGKVRNRDRYRNRNQHGAIANRRKTNNPYESAETEEIEQRNLGRSPRSNATTNRNTNYGDRNKWQCPSEHWQHDPVRRYRTVHFEAASGCTIGELAGETIESHLERGLMQRNGSMLCLTPAGMMISDSIACELL